MKKDFSVIDRIDPSLFKNYIIMKIIGGKTWRPNWQLLWYNVRLLDIPYAEGHIFLFTAVPQPPPALCFFVFVTYPITFCRQKNEHGSFILFPDTQKRFKLPQDFCLLIEDIWLNTTLFRSMQY